MCDIYRHGSCLIFRSAACECESRPKCMSLGRSGRSVSEHISKYDTLLERKLKWSITSYSRTGSDATRRCRRDDARCSANHTIATAAAFPRPAAAADTWHCIGIDFTPLTHPSPNEREKNPADNNYHKNTFYHSMFNKI